MQTNPNTITHIKSTLDHLLSDLRNVQLQFMDELQKCPAGVLKRQRNRGRIQYVQVTFHNGKRTPHGITRNQQLVRRLSRKEFLKSGIELLQNDIVEITTTLEKSMDLDTDQILTDLRARFPELPEDYFFDSNWFNGVRPVSDDLEQRLRSHDAWASMPYEKSNYKPQGRKIRTSRGLLVRTKSEALICERFYEYGIPFRYEQVLHTADGIIVPDFTFETAVGTELYWEHAGMLTDPIYSFRHHLKMMQYEAFGLYPWRNLIVTYDIENEIDNQRIDAIIQHFLLPLL